MKNIFKNQSIVDLTIWIFAAVALTTIVFLLNGCSWLNEPIQFIDPDIVIEQDTIPQDTIPVDTCEEYIEYDQPEFVGLYVKFDFPQDSILWKGGGISSHDLGEVVSHVTSLPFKFGVSPIGAWVIIEGTNDHKAFELKIFTSGQFATSPIYRGADPALPVSPNLIPATIVNTKWYFGTGRQIFILPGADEATYISLIDTYPSFDMFSFYGVTLDSVPEVNVLRETLKGCRKGRDYADLYFTLYDHEQTLIDSFGVGFADWDRVRTH